MTNRWAGPYRQVAVARVDVALDERHLHEYLLGREVYRRTQYVVVRRGLETAVVEVTKAPTDQVMATVSGVAVLARPADCAYVEDAQVDTGVPSALAAAAAAHAPDARLVVVEGRYHHVNFILDPSPVEIRVVDVVPPDPPKLFDQAARILDVAEELPPIRLVPTVFDLADLARHRHADRYLLPCRGSGFVPGEPGTQVAFLDERPPRQEWTLIGCARSRELHRWFYGDLPAFIDMCPRRLATTAATPGVTLTKCCLLEDRIDTDGTTVVVPWGATLEQVRQGLALAAAAGGGASDGEPTNGGAVTHGAVTDGAPTDGGAVTHGAVTDGAPADRGAVTHGAVTDGAPADRLPAKGAPHRQEPAWSPA